MSTLGSRSQGLLERSIIYSSNEPSEIVFQLRVVYYYYLLWFSLPGLHVSKNVGGSVLQAMIMTVPTLTIRHFPWQHAPSFALRSSTLAARSLFFFSTFRSFFLLALTLSLCVAFSDAMSRRFSSFRDLYDAISPNLDYGLKRRLTFLFTSSEVTTLSSSDILSCASLAS